MISKNKIKLIQSLNLKKNRIEQGLFVAEGPKLVGELMATGQPRYVAAEQTWMSEHAQQLKGVETDVVTAEELTRASLQKNPQQVIALFPTLADQTPLAHVAGNELCLALDGVQDPGNLGTIVRLADWFGIRHIYCSHETADIYNPKATQATMGALARVRVHYMNLTTELASTDAPIYGTHLDGTNIYDHQLSQHGVLVMGNEGKGISPQVEQLVSKKLYIPPYPADNQTVESLNVAIATAIVCAEFRRRK